MVRGPGNAGRAPRGQVANRARPGAGSGSGGGCAGWPAPRASGVKGAGQARGDEVHGDETPGGAPDAALHRFALVVPDQVARRGRYSSLPSAFCSHVARLHQMQQVPGRAGRTEAHRLRPGQLVRPGGCCAPGRPSRDGCSRACRAVSQEWQDMRHYWWAGATQAGLRLGWAA